LKKEVLMLANANGILGASQREAFAKGEAEALLEVLAARGLSVTPVQRERIHACSDGAVLKRWIRGAVTAGSVDELLANSE
jgi:hypothetical protein